MSSIEGIDKIGEQAARIEIQGPENGTNGALPTKPQSEWTLRTPDGEEADIVSITEERAAVGAPVVRLPEEPLFNSSAYVAVPEVDGQTIDKLVIAFSGSVAYDATDEEGAKMFNDLALGKAVELRVAGFVSKKEGAYKVTATEEEVVTGKATVRVNTLYLLTPEHLV